MKFFIRLFLSSLAVILTAYLLPGVKLESFMSAIIVAALLGLLNVTVKPLLIILTIPFTIVTFGLFLLVINALIILLANSIIPGFEVDGFWWALAFSLILSILTSLFHDLSGKNTVN